jgi:hypothetical protein
MFGVAQTVVEEGIVVLVRFGPIDADFHNFLSWGIDTGYT